jgi:hypothetical protein
MSTHLGDSFDYDFTQLHMAISCKLHNTIFLLVLNMKEFEKPKKKKFHFKRNFEYKVQF